MARPKTSSAKPGLTFDDVRALALALAAVEEGTSYGTPAFKVAGKLIARLKEDGETLVVRIDMDARDMLMRSEPETFFITDHYAGYPAVLVRLPRVQRGALGALLEEAWRMQAPKRLLTAKPAPAAKSTPAAKPAPAAKSTPAAKPAPAAKSTPAAKAAPTAKPMPVAKPAPAVKKKPRAVPHDPFVRVREICLALPDTAEGINHSRPCFEVGGKTFVMFMDNHHGDGRLAIWCKAPPGAQATLVEADPRRFFVPPYVGPRGWVGARLDTRPDWGAVAACVEESWRMTAPKRVLAKYGER